LSTYTWDHNRLTVEDTLVEFPHRIASVRLCHGRFIVVLDPMATTDHLNNVYAVNHSGEVLWRVQDASHVYPVQNDDPYTVVLEGDHDTLVVTNFSGVRYVVDASNGQIIDKTPSVK
jgi:hypothetical protein